MDSEKKQDLSSLSREELEAKILELELHNLQLRNLTLKSNDTTSNCVKSGEKSAQIKNFDFSKYTKRHILIKFTYLGWDRYGFAMQKHTENTVEAAFLDALLTTKLIESRETSNYQRCGRTDRGVSAFSQVISITVRSNLPYLQTEDGKKRKNNSPEALKRELNYAKILNKVLPSDIRVLAWSPAPEKFSARFNCSRRTYKYFFPRANLNLEAMNKAAQYLIGEHDYRNFCKWNVRNGIINFKRKILSISIKEIDNEELLRYSKYTDKDCDCEEEKCPVLPWEGGYKMCVAEVEGLAFLWHQIRAIMSVLFLVGEGKEEPEVIQKLLDIDAVERKPQYSIALGVGLNLYNCHFENETITWQFDERNLAVIVSQLQAVWMDHATKSTMLYCMLNDISSIFTQNFPSAPLPADQATACLPESTAEPYKPLLKRMTCESLECRVKYYIKRQCLDPSVLKKIQK